MGLQGFAFVDFAFASFNPGSAVRDVQTWVGDYISHLTPTTLALSETLYQELYDFTLNTCKTVLSP